MAIQKEGGDENRDVSHILALFVIVLSSELEPRMFSFNNCGVGSVMVLQRSYFCRKTDYPS
jgi:hypothetical protein